MDLVKRPQLSVEIPQEVADLFDLSENLEGAVPRLPQIDIIHAGQLFKMPDETNAESIEGVIIDKHTTRAWWEKTAQESGGVSRPDCFSMDGVAPEDSDAKQSVSCDNCSWNVYGSDRKGGKGKDCKEMRRIHLIMEGAALPRRLTIGPTSLSNFDVYMTSLVDMGLPYSVVVTEFSLEKKEAEGNIYSVVKPRKNRVLNKDEILSVAGYIKKYKSPARGQEIQSDEYVKPEDTSFNYGEKNDIPY